MAQFRQLAVAGVAALLALAGLSDVAAAQSVLDRSPNLSGGWVGARGTLQFNFTHRFRVLDAPGRQVTNVPTFLIGYRPSPSFPLLIGFNYASSSLIVPNYPNEFEVFGRAAALSADRGAPVDLSIQASYHQAAKSFDAEVLLGGKAGPLRLFGVGRMLSNGYAADTARYAVGGGGVLRLTSHVALAGDVTTLLERRGGEDVAWGAALQLAVPYSPHTLSLQVTNVATATLQGSSRGTDVVRGGFEFTIPITVNRNGGGGRPRAAEGGGGRAEGGTVIDVSIRQMAFPPRVESAAGVTVEWTNHDMVVHTVTADDGSWDSGSIAPGATWRRRFEQAGDYAYHCTPHPYMKGAVIVR
jgi:plastocyanin